MVVERKSKAKPRLKPGVGHNSVQVPHNGRLTRDQIKDMDVVWRAAERNMSRRERTRLLRLGRIVPASRMKPQMMVKDENGRWCPALSIHN